VSRFNTLYLGRAEDAAEALEGSPAELYHDPSADELRVALINALRRIEQLERRMERAEGHA